jgi:quinoprotein glucose dehydrogenase
MIKFTIVSALVPLLLAATTAPSTAPSRSVWDGVYSKAQADRGKSAYNSLCARCHGDTLLGNDDAPQLVDKEFLSKWEGKSLGTLIGYTQKEMPTDGPGKISRRQCTDIIAYLLSVNSFPAGQNELAQEPETQNAITIKSQK